jgi:hypothetical protein
MGRAVVLFVYGQLLYGMASWAQCATTLHMFQLYCGDTNLPEGVSGSLCIVIFKSQFYPHVTVVAKLFQGGQKGCCQGQS